MGCGSLIKFITKTVLFLLNFIFTIAGLAIAIAAIVLYVKLKDLIVSSVDEEGFMESTFQCVSIAIISLGFVIFIIAFCGCVGSITESKCLLITYAICMLGIICGKTYVAIQYKDHKVLQRPVEKFMRTTFNSSDTLTFHLFEVSIHCCGTQGPSSYAAMLEQEIIKKPELKAFSGMVPASCCAKKITSFQSFINLYHKFIDISKSKDMEKKLCLKDAASNVGCLKEVYDIIKKYWEIIMKYMIAIIAVEALEFFAAVFLCVVKSQKRKNKRDSY